MKGQGLPKNTIVLAILALLVLVILAAIFVPGFRSLLMSIILPAPTEEQTFTRSCNEWCKDLNNRFNRGNIGQIVYTEWCNKFITPYSGGDCPTKDRCYPQPDGDACDESLQQFSSGSGFPEKVKVSCSFTLTTGETCTPESWVNCCKNGDLESCCPGLAE